MLDGLKYYSAGNTLYHILKDHLCPASIITIASGVTISGGEQRYYPYGESRLTATMLTDKLFTGQREMAGLGIYHYQARFYSPKLGRFLSPDIIVPGYGNPQNLNRYAYTLNNPLRYTDPTGHMVAGDTKEAGCSFQGPACIMDMYGGHGDTDGMMDSLRHYHRRHKDYNPSTDPELSQEQQALVSIAIYQAEQEDAAKIENSWDRAKAALQGLPEGVSVIVILGVVFGGGGPLDDSISQTLKRIDEGGPFSFRQDGQIFQNQEKLLPQKPPGYYQEYTVTTPGTSNRGTVRIVTGKNGEAYVTYDHYKSFTRIR